ncbi:PAS and ANTAR domain-containing protein [Nocardia brasiliensis]|uniref:PAS and ANTAR domain-containing protein n=1 Tax=Nocardia brasiliensis TaxID=37326 RepID=UPI00190F9FED|nr:PAS and ANTAR domain-containing protein [Nocardia brasiliensis]
MTGDALPARASTEDFEHVIGGTPQRVGTFWYWFADQRWEWSPEVAELHGYQPGTVQPTTELLLAHRHPDDSEQVAAAIAAAVENRQPFSSRHRLVDATGAVRHVMVVGDHLYDGAGQVIGTTGYYVDITATVATDKRAVLTETLPEVVEARAAIEQAKGMLMLAYGIDADQAFNVLRWRSQETNIKLRALSEQFIADVTGSGAAPTALRTRIDHVLLTAHQRVPSAPDADLDPVRPEGDGVRR